MTLELLLLLEGCVCAGHERHMFKVNWQLAAISFAAATAVAAAAAAAAVVLGYILLNCCIYIHTDRKSVV